MSIGSLCDTLRPTRVKPHMGCIMKRFVWLSLFSFLVGAFATQGFSAEEVLKYPTGLVKPKGWEPESYFEVKAKSVAELPDHFDLREKGYSPEIRDQGQCGSCWAFAGVGVLEGALLKHGKQLNLSEQEVVSCDKSAYGCSGGWEPAYLTSHGVGLEADFPYVARNAACKKLAVAAKALKWSSLGAKGRSATDLELATYLETEQQPVWITVAASGSWNSVGEYKTSCRRGQTNHAVNVIGFEKDPKGGFWFIVRNSWGTRWGDKGFTKMHLGCDNLGETISVLTVDDEAL